MPIHHSNPSETSKIIYLDFDGHQQAASGYTAPSNCPTCSDGLPAYNARPWTTDGSSSFSAGEKEDMSEIWQRVAEDFAGFDVDVTTEEPATIDRRVCRVLITEKKQVGNNGNMPFATAAGYAWIDVYDTTNFIADFSPALGRHGWCTCAGVSWLTCVFAYLFCSQYSRIQTSLESCKTGPTALDITTALCLTTLTLSAVLLWPLMKQDTTSASGMTCLG